MKSIGIHMAEHAEIGPSGLGAIMLCPGMVRMQRGRKDETSFAAANGTVAHMIGEKLLKGEQIPKVKKILQEGHEIPVDKDMLDAVQVYIDHVNEIRERNKENYCIEGIEAKGDLGFLGIPEIFGTCDCSLSVPFKTLYVRDYKHGQGVLVDAEKNPQLMAYALIAGQGMIGTFDTIDMGIVQPRGRSGETIKTWQTTPSELMEWVESELKPTVKLAMSKDAPIVPGEKQCQWCKAKDICPALANKAIQVAQEDFKDFAKIRPDEVVEAVDIEKVAKVYENLPLLKMFIKAVEGRVFSELSKGLAVPGYKLVAGKRSRRWLNEESAEKCLRGNGIDPYEYSMLSPAKAEKALGKAKKEVQEFIEVSEGNPVIVPETDKRSAISIATIDFKKYA